MVRGAAGSFFSWLLWRMRGMSPSLLVLLIVVATQFPDGDALSLRRSSRKSNFQFQAPPNAPGTEKETDVLEF